MTIVMNKMVNSDKKLTLVKMTITVHHMVIKSTWHKLHKLPKPHLLINPQLSGHIWNQLVTHGYS